MSPRTLLFAALVCATLPAAEQRGTVRSGGLPIPGATVIARSGEHKVVVSTDETGAYVLPNLQPGAWTVEVEMMGFAPVSKEVAVTDNGAPLELELKLQVGPPALARVQPAKPVQPSASAAAPAKVPAQGPSARQAPSGAPQRGGRPGANGQQQPQAGFQRVDVAQTDQAELQSTMAALQPAQEVSSQDANESFLVNGSLSRGLEAPQRMDESFAGMYRGDMRPGMEGSPGTPGGFGAEGAGESRMGGSGGPVGRGGPVGGPGGFGGGGFGGRGGPGGGPGGGRPGMSRDGRRPSFDPRAASFGNRNRRGREPFRGMASFSLRNSALDAKPYSLNGQDVLKPSYAQSRFSLGGGGVLHIPRILTDDKTFVFINYSGSRSRNPYNSISTMPSPLERGGDFSQSIASGPAAIFDGAQPFAGNVIPPARLNPASRALVSLIPSPNQPGRVQNYQFLTSVPQNSDNGGVRLNRSLSRKDRLSGGFNMQQRDGNNAQLYGFRDTSNGRGISTNVTWTHNFSARLINNARVNFSRNSSEMLPFFAYGVDWARQLGILGTSTDPRNYGPPNLSFTNFGGLNDGSPSQQHNQTTSVGDSVIRVRGKHNISAGFDYSRIQLNTVSDQNARGTFTFTGLATSGFDAAGFPVAGTGFDFADFLLGYPQSSSIRFGSSDVYFRSSSYSAHAQDDWRIRTNLSINAGVRYEYLTPIHEKYGRMANLDIAPARNAVAVVTPGAAGPYTGAFPDGLVDPDHNNIAPRIGIAWRPIPAKHLQVRAGYGWYFNGSVYNMAANRMAQQPPFAKASTVNTSLDRTLTIQDGFRAGNTKQVTNTFAIDRFYRVGYAQTWNLSVQQDLPFSTVLEVGYLATKGTRLDVQRMPNRAAPGSPLTSEQRRLIGNATGFTLDSSDGNSIYHAGQVRITRRFRQGFSANALYNYAKSIDNASTIGGGGAVVVQDDHNLAAERGRSSFDRRHTLNVFFMLGTPGGRSGSDKRNVLLRDWSLTGGITMRSGSPFTAKVLGNQSDTGGSGAVGSGRADATGIPLALAGYFFNPAAFTVPLPGRFGNAGRNTITGPSFASVNMSFGRSIRFGESRRGMDVRVEANNVLNSLNVAAIGTTVNSSNYGLALDAGAMRSMTMNLRFRF